MNIRLLNDSDALVYREVRLCALKNDPDAFGSTYEQEETKPLGHITDISANNVIL